MPRIPEPGDEDFTTVEVLNGALYTVKYKQAHAARSQPGQTAYEVVKSLMLSAAPLDRVITELLINQESTFLHVFFTTYHAFTTIEYVLDQLYTQLQSLPLDVYQSDVYMSSDVSHVRSCTEQDPMADKNNMEECRARNVEAIVKTWIRVYSNDFKGKPELCEKLLKIVELSFSNTFFDAVAIAKMIESINEPERLSDAGISRSLLQSSDLGSSMRARSSDAGRFFTGRPSDAAADTISVISSRSVSAIPELLMLTSRPQSVVVDVSCLDDVSSSLPSPKVSPANSRVNSMSKAPSPKESIQPYDMAVELTRMDADLFRLVKPSECLAAVWSKRGRKSMDGECVASTVMRTVEQFNRVCNLVMTSVLDPPEFLLKLATDILVYLPDNCRKRYQRAHIITYWIDTAQECRNLRNYSALRAILSALGATSISRLHRVWDSVERDIREVFDMLSSLISAEENEYRSRELLTKEGTAKHALQGCQSVDKDKNMRVKRLLPRISSASTLNHFHRALSMPGQPTNTLVETAQWTLPLAKTQPRSAKVISTGVVPYLGMFLTDLMMVDTAHQDYITSDSDELKGLNLLNFKKRRKEFEILAQIGLFQKQAKVYVFKGMPNFTLTNWVATSPVLTEKECYEMSVSIEGKKPSISTLDNPNLAPAVATTATTTAAAAARAAATTGTRTLAAAAAATTAAAATVVPQSVAMLRSSKRVISKTDLTMAPTETMADGLLSPTKQRCAPTSAMINDGVIARIAIHKGVSQGATALYQAVLLQTSMKTHQLLDKVIARQGIAIKMEDVDVYQVLRDNKFLQIPPGVNVFYAVKAEANPLCFYIVRKGHKPQKLPSKIRKNAFFLE